MKIKPGANIQGIDYKLRPVLIHADEIWKKHDQELVITAGMDGEHSAGSLHYYGLALDLRTSYFKPEVAKAVHAELVAKLGKNFDAVLEKSHCHVEWDPK